ncbi:MAG TPA: bifunctional phosphopantothenoylcysteine decarboxylase/phosphopantothenate--cysteine ligase CoaBC [Anaerolineae bacterium]|nr:bifunctional phosphopantothenoylcysteine decarboxylase/phosphopantothenate--cysteine ligase CoaBC [Anaerolineae bacterium]HIQ09564.1 bifunctional phosphopantothenoylcysteine decarboxylase/phosphopantothenate--cysteine ligase CoaBC [Anaerolineaceae bacterium]
MIPPLYGKRVLLGVTGSVAAYKSAHLASRLRQAGAQVTVVLTPAAERFVSPLTFRAVAGGRVYTDADLWGTEGHILHIGLAQQVDVLLIAPCTANTLAKLAHGQADNLLTVTALAATCPVLVAPAMDGDMWTHPATQANVARLEERGVQVLGPDEGHLASGLQGIGRMLEPEEILARVRYLLTRKRPLQGRRVLVTAGGTQEPLDPVRLLTNRSTGKQGFALAQAALDWGAEVTLIAAPTSLPTPHGAQRVDVRTALEMRDAVFAHLNEAEMLFMSAAVADYRPAHPSPHKIKKSTADLTLTLTRNPDILTEVASYRRQKGHPPIVVGFAAESQDLLANAREKLARKALDLIVANDISAADAGFAVDTNRATLLYADGRQEALPRLSKAEMGQAVVVRALHLWQGGWLAHLVSPTAWEAAQAQDVYRPPSLDEVGFIHFSRPDQVPRVAQTFFANRPLLLLWVQGAQLGTALRWEEADGDLFPHLYAPLPVEAVAAVTPYGPDETGHYAPPKPPEQPPNT